MPIGVAIARDGSAAFESRSFVVTSLFLVAAGLLAPRWLVMALWRLVRRRNHEQWM